MQKSFSLALGGGAARWFAHIGVIRRLEELGQVPQEISGTSIGALIGAFYAAGYSSLELENITQDIKFLKLIDLDLKHGLLKGDKIIKFLKKHLGDITFKELKIPLTIVSTDIDSGKAVLFTTGNLLEAVRASIGIPGVFTPYKHGWVRLVDGGIIENLPIGVLSPEYPVVAVSVQLEWSTKKTQEKKSFFFPDGTLVSNSYTLLRRTVQIMMLQNELTSLKSRNDIFFIRPEREGIDYYEFTKMKEMIEEGYLSSSILIDFFDQP